jgi:hypothetical protein
VDAVGDLTILAGLLDSRAKASALQSYAVLVAARRIDNLSGSPRTETLSSCNRRRPYAVDGLAISSQSPFCFVGENFAGSGAREFRTGEERQSARQPVARCETAFLRRLLLSSFQLRPPSSLSGGDLPPSGGRHRLPLGHADEVLLVPNIAAHLRPSRSLGGRDPRPCCRRRYGTALRRSNNPYPPRLTFSRQPIATSHTRLWLA